MGYNHVWNQSSMFSRSKSSFPWPRITPPLDYHLNFGLQWAAAHGKMGLGCRVGGGVIHDES
jgi:hypothetical protein